MIVAKIGNIDGIKTVIGLSELQVDPVETERAIKEEYQKCDEYQALAVRLTKIRSYTQGINSDEKSASRVFLRAAQRLNKIVQDVKREDMNPSENQKLLELANLVMAKKGSIKSIEAELPEVDVNLKQKRISLMKIHAVYFEPGKDDVKISKAQVAEFRPKLKSRGKKQFLTLDGEIIDDNRGRITYFKNSDDSWNIKTIAVLNEKIDSLAIFSEDLTDEQRQEIGEYQEAVRVFELNPIKKLEELEAMKEQAAGQAAFMRSKLEIQEDPDALTKAKDWYNAEVVKLEDKYK